MRYLAALTLACLTLLIPACDSVSPVAPAGTTITLSVNPTRINIDGQASVTAIVRLEDGSPVNPGTEVNFSTSLGRIDPAAAKTNDSGVAETQLSGAGQIGMATVTASTGAAAAVTAEVQIGSLASSMTLQASPTSIGQSGGDIELLAVVRDDAGQLLENLAVNFGTTGGTLESRGAAVLTNEGGEARDLLSLTQGDVIALDEAFVVISAFAATEGGALLEATTEVSIRGVVSFISLQVSPGSIPEDGGTLELLALVKDDIGNGVSGAGVNFLTEAGSLASGGAVQRTDGNGQARDTLTVTAQDLASLGTRSFTVRAQTNDFSGALLEASFEVLLQRGVPTADFEWESTGVAGEVRFINTTTGEEPLSFQWNFGDEGAGESNARNPTYTYVNKETGELAQVVLVATNPLGTDTVTQTITVP
jgi:hypothetical protein